MSVGPPSSRRLSFLELQYFTGSKISAVIIVAAPTRLLEEAVLCILEHPLPHHMATLSAALNMLFVGKLASVDIKLCLLDLAPLNGPHPAQDLNLCFGT